MAEDIARILSIPLGGWDYYVKFEWPLLDNLAAALAIIWKFPSNLNLLQHLRVLKREMSPLQQLYFDVAHKMITPLKERCTKANYLDITLM